MVYRAAHALRFGDRSGLSCGLCCTLVLAWLLGAAGTRDAEAGNSGPIYDHPGAGLIPTAGNGLVSPRRTFGKELSLDGDSAVSGGALQPQMGQVLAWDGAGGMANGKLLKPVPFDASTQYQVDALANHADTLFQDVVADTAHIVFSVSAQAGVSDGLGQTRTIPAAGPLVTTSDWQLGGSAEISYELASSSSAPKRQGIWATQMIVAGNVVTTDVDGLELWGPEPGTVFAGESAATSGDSDKFSIQGEALFSQGDAYAIWNEGTRPGFEGYLLHSDLVSAVSGLLGWSANYQPDATQVNLDATMVHDKAGDNPDVFNIGDEVLLSLEQIPDGFGGFYTTGSELILLERTVDGFDASFLFHNGHYWDKDNALENMVWQYDANTLVVLDINSLEATAIPEPTALAVVSGLAIAALGWMHRRRHGS